MWAKMSLAQDCQTVQEEGSFRVTLPKRNLPVTKSEENSGKNELFHPW